jgi:hypothetical protein
MVTAVVNWPGLFLLFYYVRSEAQFQLQPIPPAVEVFLLVLLVLAIIGANVLFYSGLKMKRLESSWLAIAGAVLALLVPPAYLIGWPMGLWALAVLTAPEVKAAFGRSDRQT